MILPFTILRRLECVLAASKAKVLDQVGKLMAMPKLEEDARDKFLRRAAGDLSFYNTSPMDLYSRRVVGWSMSSRMGGVNNFV